MFRQIILFFLTLWSLSVISSENKLIFGEEYPGEKIVILGDQDYAPFEWFEDDEIKGIMPSIIPYLSKELERPIEYALVNWKDAQQLVKGGEADVLTIFSPNSDRIKDYDFVESFLTVEMSIFVKSSSVTIHNLKDLRNKNVGVIKGSILDNYVKEESKVIPIYINDHEDGFNKVLSGELDAVVTSKWVGAYTLQKLGITGIKYVYKPIFTKGTHLGVKKGNTKLINDLKSGIKSLKKNNVLKELTNEWEDLEIIYLTKGKIRTYTSISIFILIMAILIIAFIYIFALRKKVQIKTASLRDSLNKLILTQDKLVQTQKVASLSSLLNGISHTLNTPLGICITAVSQILDNIEKLKKNSSEGFDNETILNQEKAVLLLDETLNKAIKLLKSYRNLTNHHFNLQKENFNIGNILTTAAYSHTESIKERDINLIINGDESLTLESYPTVLTEVISHLIDNSIKHGLINSNNPKISIIYSQSKINTLITIKDNGIGIKDDHLPQIFDPLFTTKLATGSSGLGLSIIYTLITGLFEGEIKVSNDLGAEFQLILPNKIENIEL